MTVGVVDKRFRYLDKDDGRGNGHQTVELDEGEVLVLVFADVEIHLLDTLDGELGLLEGEDIRIGCEKVGEAQDLVREGGGE